MALSMIIQEIQLPTKSQNQKNKNPINNKSLVYISGSMKQVDMMLTNEVYD
jgi:hypothetical protein